MKRILVMSIGTEIGGIERSLIEFLKYIVTQDCSVDLYLWQEPGPLFNRIPAEVHIIDRELYPRSLKTVFQKKGGEKILAFFRYVGFRISRALRYPTTFFPRFSGEYDIAIAFCHNGFSPEYVATKVNAKKKYMFFRHGEYEYEKYPWKHFNKIYQKFDNVVAVSEATRTMLQKVFPELKNILVVKNLFDETSIMEKSNISTETFTSSQKCKLCSVGRLSSEKGQMFAVSVAKALRDKSFDFEWIFVGDGFEKGKCLKLVENYNLEKYCRFIGARENPYPYMKECDIYVQTSFVEANPGTIQEAKILQKPIIATNLPSIQEALDNMPLSEVCELNEEKFARKIIAMYDTIKMMKQSDIIEHKCSMNEDNRQIIKQWLGI